MPTARELADAVRVKAGHQVAEHRLAELRAKRDRLRTEWLAANSSDADERAKRLAASKYELDSRELEKTILDVRYELQPLRAAHAERVANALHEHQAERLARIVSAIDELSMATKQFNDGQACLRRWGADAEPLGLPDLAGLRRRAAGEH